MIGPTVTKVSAFKNNNIKMASSPILGSSRNIHLKEELRGATERQYPHYRAYMYRLHSQMIGQQQCVFGMADLWIVGISLLVALAQSGMCHCTALSTWDTACQFGGNVTIIEGNILLSQANCNSLYDKRDWQKTPKIFYPNAIQNSLYTVLVLDPDAPAHPKGSYYLHMIEANLKGEDLRAGNFEKSLTIAPYIGPAPPLGSGDHRYMFVAYRHCKSTRKLRKMRTPDRPLFNLSNWFESLSVKLHGPEAGLQFRARF